jgi:hypothetical protein
MATVRFSETLKQIVRKNARNMFSSQVQKAKDSFDPLWGDKIYDKLFSADDIAKFNTLPKWAMPTKDSIELEGFYGNDDVWQTADIRVNTWNLRDNITMHFASTRPWPHDFGAAPTGAKVSWRSLMLDFHDTRWDWLKDEFKAYTNRIFQARAKEESFVDGVEKLMSTYSTLAPALKAWPALWDLLDEETKDRHKKIVERTTRDIETVDVDLNSMTAAVTFNKLTK